MNETKPDRTEVFVNDFLISIFLFRYHHPVFDPDCQAGKLIPAPSHPYRTVGCVFNHQSFYANSHHSDSVLTCVFDIQDHTLWKPMSKDAIASITTSMSSVSSVFFMTRS